MRRIGIADRILLALAALVMAAVVVEAAWRLLRDNRVPVSIAAVEALNSPISATGGDLVVRIYREKVRACPLTSEREVINDNGRSTAIMSPEMVVGGPTASDHIDVSYPIPPLPSGGYWLRVNLTYHCADQNYRVQQPDVRFTVQ